MDNISFVKKKEKALNTYIYNISHCQLFGFGDGLLSSFLRYKSDRTDMTNNFLISFYLFRIKTIFLSLNTKHIPNPKNVKLSYLQCFNLKSRRIRFSQLLYIIH